MSRQRINMLDGSLLVVGYDAPMSTWYAQHYDRGQSENDPPRVAIGYSAVEAAILLDERPDAIVGPYPVEDVEELLLKLIPELMGITPLPEQSDCTYCKQPRWRSNPDCPHHPYDRLRYG